MMFLPLVVALAGEPQVPVHLERLAAEYRVDYGRKVSLKAQWCGDDNAWYTIGENTVTLCADLFDRPLLARWVLRHELGHAINDQYHIPWIDYEAGADELAMLAATEAENMSAFYWFSDMARAKMGVDPHPAMLDRAAAIACYLDGTGADPISRTCVIYAKSVEAAWNRLLVSE